MRQQTVSMRKWLTKASAIVFVFLFVGHTAAQLQNEPDGSPPGDPMIQEYLRQETDKIHDRFLRDVESQVDLQKLQPKYRQDFLTMLGRCLGETDCEIETDCNAIRTTVYSNNSSTLSPFWFPFSEA